MSDLKPTLDKLPNWPRWLNQRQAAAYVGVSTGTFKKEHEAGLWPAPGRAAGRWQLWDRVLLDAASDRLSGLTTAPGDPDDGPQPKNYFDERLARHGNGQGPTPRRPPHRG